MNAFCAVMVDRPAVAAARQTSCIPTPEKRLRIRLPSNDISDDEVTTPEASTDSDNDSAFESENEEIGRKRGAPTSTEASAHPPNLFLHVDRRWRCNISSSNTTTNKIARQPLVQLSQQQQQQPQQQIPEQQPLPLKVRFKLPTSVSTDADPKKSSDETENRGTSVIEVKGVLRMRPPAICSPSALRRGLSNGGRRDARSGYSTIRAASERLKSGEPRRAPWSAPSSFKGRAGGSRVAAVAGAAAPTRQNHMAAPLREITLNKCRSTGTHNGGARTRLIHRGNGSASANACGYSTALNANTTVLLPARTTPASPKKRKVCSVASMLRLRAKGRGSGLENISSGTTTKTSDQSSRMRGVVPPTPHAKMLEQEALRAATRTARSALHADAAGKDLLCKEVLDMDAIMRPKGEIRTPICRFLLPSWPEGVEGYEEAGGWRRLGGTTKETFPRGRRALQ